MYYAKEGGYWIVYQLTDTGSFVQVDQYETQEMARAYVEGYLLRQLAKSKGVTA